MKRTIAVIGSGIAGWSLVCALTRVFDPSVVEIIFLNNSEADSFPAESADSHIHHFNDLLGVTLSDVIKKTNSTLSYGTRYKNWAFNGQDSMVSECPALKNYIGEGFAKVFSAAKRRGLKINIDELSLAAVAARSGRFGFPQGKNGAIYSSLEFGINLDVVGYVQLISAVAESAGAVNLQARVVKGCFRENTNYLESLILDNGQEIFADLYIDCSNSGDLTRKIANMHVRCEQRVPHVPKLIMGNICLSSQFRPCSEWVGLRGGVAQIISLREKTSVSVGLFSCAAEADLPGLQIADVSVGQENYNLECFWVSNVVAMGRSAFSLPPSPWGEYKWFRNQVARFIELFTDFEAMDYCAKEYSRLTRDEYKVISDLIKITYYMAASHNKGVSDFFNNNPLSGESQHLLRLAYEGVLQLPFDNRIVSVDRLEMLFLACNFLPHQHCTEFPPDMIKDVLKQQSSICQVAACKLPFYEEFIRRYIGC